jgi:hypothetical protein
VTWFDTGGNDPPFEPVGRRLSDPLQSEDPNQTVPVIVSEIMRSLDDQIVFPSLAEIRERLGLDGA